jgi:hypothetical protein
MLVRNYAKPFCIAGFILAEIYMLFVVLAPNTGRDPSRTLLSPIVIESTTPADPAVPTGYKIGRVLVASIYFGPAGALVGLGVGLAFSAVAQALRRK